MKANSYSRVTLALDIIQRLTHGEYKGFHELNIIKQQISLYDVIEIENSDFMSISCNDPQVPVDTNNLCWKAVDIVKKKFKIKKNVHISIKKNIPVRAGLAGGSANAVTVLKVLNVFWKLDLERAQLCELGCKIGMDLPFFFFGGTAFDTETTGILEPIVTDINFDFVLVISPIGISTSDAYREILYNNLNRNREKTVRMKNALKNKDQNSVINTLHNDFEYSVFKHYPILKQLKKRLIQAGCLNAVMSGSGSTLIGIAEDRDHAEWISKHFPGSCITVSSYKEA